MSQPKTYTLELSGEELLANGPYGLSAVNGSGGGYNINKAVSVKLNQLHEQARADREAEDLKLPWTAERDLYDFKSWRFASSNWTSAPGFNERQAKLAAAAPELFEALKAISRMQPWPSATDWEAARPLIERAIRKAETGTPERGR